MKTLLTSLAVTALASFAATAQASMKDLPQVEDYRYGTRLDIAEVTQAPSLDFCGIRPVEIHYVDHMGQAHTLRYQANGTGCRNMN